MASNDPFYQAGWTKNAGGAAFIDSSGRIASYSYSSLANTPAATPTDIIVIQGSATKIVRIRRIVVGGIAGTAGTLPIALIRRSTAAVGGTATTPTPMIRDPNADAAATAVLQLFTANPTAGTTVGTLTIQRVFLNLTTAATDRFNLLQDSVSMRPVTLNGTSDFLAINGNGATVPASGVLDFTIDWTEE